MYIIGVHDKGQLTGLCWDNIIATYLNLMDSAREIGMHTCLRAFKKIGDDRYWAILQVFDTQSTVVAPYTDTDIPPIPKHNIPDYLVNAL